MSRSLPVTRVHYPLLWVVCVLAYAPHAHASVMVSEIAWMGSAENANAEWVELTSDTTVDLTGWILNALDGQPAIPLSGTINAGEYVLLERTTDDTVPSIAARVIYTGAMGNTGEIFVLTDASGAIVDRVDGSADWAIGGDNTAKLTLQRSGGGWVTAAATPGVPNARQDDPAHTSTSDTSASSNGSNAVVSEGTRATGAHTTKEVNLPPSPDPALVVRAGSDVVVPARVPHTFTAELFKEGGKPITLNTVVWNFGDGSTGDGRTVEHTYPFPGTYVVRVRATRTLFRDPITAEDQVVVTVVPLEVSISHADSASIEVTNDSAYDVDLSRFALVSGTRYFRIPRGTTLLAHAQVRFTHEVTKLRPLDTSAVSLVTPGGSRVHAPVPTGNTSSASSTEVVHDLDSSEDAMVEVSDTTPMDDVLVPLGEESGEMLAQIAGVQRQRTAQPTPPAGSPLIWWLIGLAALSGTVATAVILARREREEVIAGYVVDSDDS